MVIPVGERYQQTLYLMIKEDGKLTRKALRPTLFVPMTGSAEAQRQRFPDPAQPAVVNGNFETPLPEDVLGGDQFVPGWYYGRQLKLMRDDVGSQGGFVRFRNETPGRDAHLLQGLAIDGSVVTRVRISAKVRTEGVEPGERPGQIPTLAISFYDDQRRDLGTYWTTLYRGTRDWKEDGRTLRVPPQTREAIVRIGLFGAVGQADFDDVRLEIP